MPLHAAGADLLAELETAHRVTRSLAPDIDEAWPVEKRDLALQRPTEKLVPDDARSAPLAMLFTSFPGVILRFGWRYERAFPSCGCDACDETAEGEVKVMREEVEMMVTSDFEERIRPRLVGAALSRERFSWPGGNSSSTGNIDRAEAREWIAKDMGSREWQPWPKR